MGDHRPAREEVLSVDRRLHPVLAVHVRGDVDQKGGVRREWTQHRTQEMHLDTGKREERKILTDDDDDEKQLTLNLPVYFLSLWRMDWVCDSNLALFLFLRSSRVAFCWFTMMLGLICGETLLS